MGYSFQLTARVLLYAPSHTRIAHTTAFVTPVMEHWLERETAQCVHPMKDQSDDPSHHEPTLLPRSYISLLGISQVQIWNKIDLKRDPLKSNSSERIFLVTNWSAVCGGRTDRQTALRPIHSSLRPPASIFSCKPCFNATGRRRLCAR